jgi:sulfur-oxidizing protein SoxX
MPSAERLATLVLCALLATPTQAEDCAPLEFDGDGIPEPLLGLRGDPLRGHRVATSPAAGDCTICHRLPVAEPDPRFHGTVGPPLAGIGARLTRAQIRARIAAPKRINPHTVMPAYCSTANRWREVASAVGEPLLDAGAIEDLVAWLSTLRIPEP